MFRCCYRQWTRSWRSTIIMPVGWQVHFLLFLFLHFILYLHFSIKFKTFLSWFITDGPFRQVAGVSPRFSHKALRWRCHVSGRLWFFLLLTFTFIICQGVHSYEKSWILEIMAEVMEKSWIFIFWTKYFVLFENWKHSSCHSAKTCPKKLDYQHFLVMENLNLVMEKSLSHKQ